MRVKPKLKWLLRKVTHCNYYIQKGRIKLSFEQWYDPSFSLLPSVYLWNIQQFKLFLPSSLDARYHFSLIASERDIFLVDIPAAGFQFLNQPAFRHFPVPDQPVISHIIRTALWRAGHLFRSGCTSYTVSSNRLSTENPPALPSCGRCIWGQDCPIHWHCHRKPTNWTRKPPYRRYRTWPKDYTTRIPLCRKPSKHKVLWK